MKIIFILLIFSFSIFSQIDVKTTNSLYPNGNTWDDSVSVRETSTFPGQPTQQVRSTVALDTLMSNYYQIKKEDRDFRVFGNIYTDSVGVAPNAINTSLEIGYFYGTGGFPDITGIEWALIQTSTSEETFDFLFTDSVKVKLPQRIYFRFRELAAQRNHYNITLNVKKE